VPLILIQVCALREAPIISGLANSSARKSANRRIERSFGRDRKFTAENAEHAEKRNDFILARKQEVLSRSLPRTLIRGSLRPWRFKIPCFLCKEVLSMKCRRSQNVATQSEAVEDRSCGPDQIRGLSIPACDRQRPARNSTAMEDHWSLRQIPWPHPNHGGWRAAR
jgi:hypothetical protein